MGKKYKKRRLAARLAAVRGYHTRMESVEPVQTNWRTVAESESVDAEDLADLRIERRLEIVPSIGMIAEEMGKDIVRNDAGQTVAIGGLRFSDGTQHERAVTYGPDGKLVRFDARMPTGAMLGTRESSDTLSGRAPDAAEVSASNRFFAETLKTAPHRYVSGKRERRGGKALTRDEAQAVLSAAYANTPVLPAVTRLPAGLPCGSANAADSFVGMKKAAKGESGSIAWEDLATARTRRDAWAMSISVLSDTDRRTLSASATARSFGDIAPGGHPKAASRRGKALLIAANDNLETELRKLSYPVYIPRRALENENGVRDSHMKWKSSNADFLSRKRVVGVGNVSGVSERALEHLLSEISDVGRLPSQIANSFVYAISDEHQKFTKIGYAVSPVRRLAELQTGSPHRLMVYRAFRFPTISIAKEVEFNAHSIASRQYRRMSGEWFSCSPVQAHEIVDAAADMAGYAYCVFTPIVDKENTTPRLVA